MLLSEVVYALSHMLEKLGYMLGNEATLSSTLALMAVAWFIYAYASKFGKCKLYYMPNSTISQLLPQIPSLSTQNHYSNPLLFSGHAQTFFYSIHRKLVNSKFPYSYEHEYIAMSDGGQTSLCWPTIQGSRIPLSKKAPIVILLPGLTGGTHDVYIYNTMYECTKRGLGCVLLNHRGCSGLKIKNPTIYCASFTRDLREAATYLSSKYPSHNLYGAGYSLGANILLYYAGEEGEKCLLKGAFSICNPIDLYEAEMHMRSSIMGKLYKYTLGKHQKKKLMEHMYAFSDYYRKQYNKCLETEIEKMNDNYEFDTIFTSKMFPYHTAYNYYRKASCILKLDDIRIPTVLLQCADDPIASVYPKDEISENPNILMAICKFGGHVGMYEGLLPKQWLGTPIAEFVMGLESK